MTYLFHRRGPVARRDRLPEAQDQDLEAAGGAVTGPFRPPERRDPDGREHVGGGERRHQGSGDWETGRRGLQHCAYAR